MNAITCDAGTHVYSAYPPSNARPIPPIIATTCCPAANSPPGHDATTPAASIPSTRGNVTAPPASPSRVCSSDRLSPKALTSISTHPSSGVGTGSSRICNASGGPGASSTTARMDDFIPCTLAPAAGGHAVEPLPGERSALDRRLDQRLGDVDALDAEPDLRRRP